MFALKNPRGCKKRGTGDTETRLTFLYEDPDNRCGVEREERGVFSNTIGKKHALKKYDQFALNNTSCFCGSTRSNITPVVQFHEI